MTSLRLIRVVLFEHGASTGARRGRRIPRLGLRFQRRNHNAKGLAEVNELKSTGKEAGTKRIKPVMSRAK